MKFRAPDLETLVWTILAGGLLLSIALILAGLAWEWVVSGTLRMGPPILAVNLRGLLSSVMARGTSGLSSTVLIESGIAVLLLTPYTRVLASVFFFTFKDHNYRFSAITGFVAAVLTWVLFLR